MAMGSRAKGGDSLWRDCVRLVVNRCRFGLPVLVVTCLALCVLYILAPIVNSIVKVQTSTLEDPHNPALQDHQHIRNDNVGGLEEKPVKVILVSYMRGGSTFIGELFNLHPSGFYLFEPVDGCYMTLYGTQQSFKDLDVMFFQNGTWREKPSFEQDHIAQAMVDILNCRLAEVPTGVFMHHFFTGVNQIRRRSYVKCMEEAKKNKHVDCPYVVGGKQCPKYFEGDNLYKCYERIWADDSSEHGRNNAFQRFRQCDEQRRSQMAPCLPAAAEQCVQTDVRAIKAIRLSMETMEWVLHHDPKVKVIHYTRDPRGIVVSRSGRLMNQLSGTDKDDKLEAKYLCEFMLRNIKGMEELQQHYPRSFLEVRYEDLATDPVQVSQRVYDFLGTQLPEKVSDWIYRATHAEHKAEARFGTSRQNASSTAYAWREKVGKDMGKIFCEVCKEVLDRLKYERLHC